MSSRDDYPFLAQHAIGARSKRRYALYVSDDETRRALDEIDQLRAEVQRLSAGGGYAYQVDRVRDIIIRARAELVDEFGGATSVTDILDEVDNTPTTPPQH